MLVKVVQVEFISLDFGRPTYQQIALNRLKLLRITGNQEKFGTIAGKPNAPPREPAPQSRRQSIILSLSCLAPVKLLLTG